MVGQDPTIPVDKSEIRMVCRPQKGQSPPSLCVPLSNCPASPPFGSLSTAPVQPLVAESAFAPPRPPLCPMIVPPFHQVLCRAKSGSRAAFGILFSRKKTESLPSPSPPPSPFPLQSFKVFPLRGPTLSLLLPPQLSKASSFLAASATPPLPLSLARGLRLPRPASSTPRPALLLLCFSFSSWEPFFSH